LEVYGEYSNNEIWYVTRALEEVARPSEGNIDGDVVYDLLPFARIYGSGEELREYIAEHGLEAARWAGRELRKRQPSQALDAPFIDPAVPLPELPYMEPPPPPPVMPG